MKAPAFWSHPPGLAAALLAPAAFIYGALSARRMNARGERPPLPLLCVGNVTVGGSGKTPVALAIARLLREAGREPAFLTRGYRGRLPGPVVVDLREHDAAAVGDEALLLARRALTIVSRDRPAGAAAARGLGSDVLVMDDGLQNPSLRKTLTLAVFDGEFGIGNGRVLPAGPLRAPLSAQWPLIDGAVVVGPGPAGDRIKTEATSRGLPVFQACLRPSAEAASELSGQALLAFAGIGRPDKFFRTCREAGLTLVETRAFPDHHVFTLDEIRELLAIAKRRALRLLTTEKDAVRLTLLEGQEPRVRGVRSLPVELAWKDEGSLRLFLEDRLPAFDRA